MGDIQSGIKPINHSF